MAIGYTVYESNGTNDIINYASPVASTTGLSYITEVLAAPSIHAYGVRAFNTVTGLEEQNVDCRVTLVISSGNVDVSLRPGPPSGLTVRATAGGTALAEWAYTIIPGLAIPTGFHVWLTVGTTVNYAVAPSATVPYAQSTTFASILTGLTHGTAYVVGVRAYTTALGDETNTLSATVTGDTTGPDAVEDLTCDTVSGD